MTEGSAGSRWNATERVLTVSLGKGESATVRIACYLPGDAELRQLGYWVWMVEWLRDQIKLGKIPEFEFAARLEEFRQLSLLGLWWMVSTPYRELKLVHAVQQPIEAPKWVAFRPLFNLPGDTFSFLPFALLVHRRTQSRIELIARWTEKVDDDPTRPPRDEAREASLLAVPIPSSGDIASWGTKLAEFDASDHRMLRYLAPEPIALEAGIREVAALLSDAITRLQDAARGNEALVRLAKGVRESSQRVMVLLAYPFRELPDAARQFANIADQFTPAPDVPIDLGTVQPNVSWGGEWCSTGLPSIWPRRRNGR